MEMVPGIGVEVGACVEVGRDVGVGVGPGVGVGVGVPVVSPVVVMVTLLDDKPLELAVTTIDPEVLVAWTITRHLPLNAERDEPL